jgi:hypothetical protein
VTLDRLLSFNDVTTVFSKLTMSISNWPWLAAEHHGHDRLQLRVSHHATLQRQRTVQHGLARTYTLQGQSQPSFLAPLLKGRRLVRRIRLIDAVELVSMRSCSPTTHAGPDRKLRPPQPSLGRKSFLNSFFLLFFIVLCFLLGDGGSCG